MLLLCQLRVYCVISLPHRPFILYPRRNRFTVMPSRSRNKEPIFFFVRLLRWIDRTTNPSQRLISTLTMELLAPYKHMNGCNVLDIGCGVKPYESTLRRSLHPCSYVGIDPYPADDSIVACNSSELPFRIGV